VDCGASYPSVGSAWLEQVVRTQTRAPKEPSDIEETTNLDVFREEVLASDGTMPEKLGVTHLESSITDSAFGWRQRRPRPGGALVVEAGASGPTLRVDEPMGDADAALLRARYAAFGRPDVLAAALAKTLAKGAVSAPLGNAVRAMATASGLDQLETSRTRVTYLGPTRMAWGEMLDQFAVTLDESESSQSMGNVHLEKRDFRGTLVTRHDRHWLVSLVMRGTTSIDGAVFEETLEITRPCLRTSSGEVRGVKPCSAMGGYCAADRNGPAECGGGFAAVGREIAACTNATCCLRSRPTSVDVDLPDEPPSPEGGLCAGINEAPRCEFRFFCKAERQDELGRCVAEQPSP